MYAFKEIFPNITIDSVWLIQKSKEDEGFQKWRRDFKHKITMIVVINVGAATKKEGKISKICLFLTCGQ